MSGLAPNESWTHLGVDLETIWDEVGGALGNMFRTNGFSMILTYMYLKPLVGARFSIGGDPPRPGKASLSCPHRLICLYDSGGREA